MRSDLARTAETGRSGGIGSLAMSAEGYDRGFGGEPNGGTRSTGRIV